MCALVSAHTCVCARLILFCALLFSGDAGSDKAILRAMRFRMSREIGVIEYNEDWDKEQREAWREMSRMYGIVKVMIKHGFNLDTDYETIWPFLVEYDGILFNEKDPNVVTVFQDGTLEAKTKKDEIKGSAWEAVLEEGVKFGMRGAQVARQNLAEKEKEVKVLRGVLAKKEKEVEGLRDALAANE